MALAVLGHGRSGNLSLSCSKLPENMPEANINVRKIVVQTHSHADWPAGEMYLLAAPSLGPLCLCECVHGCL